MLGVIDCFYSRAGLVRTTADRMEAHRKSDRRRDDLCADGLGKRAWNVQWLASEISNRKSSTRISDSV